MLAELAWLSLQAGRVDDAESSARQSLALAEEIRDRAGRVFGVGLLATVAAQRRQLDHAGSLWGAIEHEDAVAPLGGWRRHRHECEALIREAAGPKFETAFAEGRTLTLDDARIASSRQTGYRDVTASGLVYDLVCSCDRSRAESRNHHLQALFERIVGHERATATSPGRQPRQHN